jgi:predicted RNase H-like HicB family nuclease
MERYRVSIIIEKDEDGFTAFCPELQGCYSQGDSYEEALENIRDVITLHIEDRRESGEPIPQAEMISLVTVDVNV